MSFDAFQRPLFAACCLSLALHALALFGWRPLRPSLPPVAPLQVSMPLPAAPAALPLAEAQPKPLPAAASRPQPRPTKMPQLALPAAEHPVSPPPFAVPAAPPGPAPMPAPPAVELRTENRMAPAAASADGLRQYRIDLAGAARRFRSYPAIARTRGWEGVAEVTITAAAGEAPALRLSRSSGHAVLDERALEMLTQAVAQTAIPDDLRSHGFIVLVPIRFSLEE